MLQSQPGVLHVLRANAILTRPCTFCRVTYTIETMKNGSVVDQRDIDKKSYYIFGRTDACDFQLEHPSISRLHAVLQLSSTGEAFLFDTGSAHGTFLNKQKLRPQMHVPLRYTHFIHALMCVRLPPGIINLRPIFV